MKVPHKTKVIWNSIKFGAYSARKSTSTYHLANSLLNILNCSPKLAWRYSNLYRKRFSFVKIFSNIISIVIVILLSFWYWPKRIKAKHKKIPCDILFVSHLTNVKHLELKEDFYFGNLEQISFENGLTTETVLINHCKANANDSHKIKKRNTTILSSYLSPLEEIKLVIKLVQASFSLPKVGEKNFDFSAKYAQFDRNSIANTRIHDQIRDAIYRFNPKIIIHTFEGHGWERMICQTAHLQPGLVKVIGYHHAVLFPGPRAMNFKYGQGADPDIILMSGDSTARAFVEQSEFSQEEVSVMGSLKHVSKDAKVPLVKIKDSCLIVPEGDISEVRIMAESGLKIASLLPSVNFILRLHPLLTDEKVRKLIPKLNQLPKNFSFSNMDLNTDISKASWILYRASSVVLSGLSRGVRPIYINSDDSNQINDPIPDSISYRKIAKTDRDIVNVIQQDISASSEKDSNEKQIGIDFAAHYYTPYDPLIFVKLAKLILLKAAND